MFFILLEVNNDIHINIISKAIPFHIHFQDEKNAGWWRDKLEIYFFISLTYCRKLRTTKTKN